MPCVYGEARGRVHRKHRGQLEGRGRGGDVARVFIMVSAGRNRQGVRLASFSNFCGIWGSGAVPSCLAPGLKWTGQGDSGPESEIHV